MSHLLLEDFSTTLHDEHPNVLMRENVQLFQLKLNLCKEGYKRTIATGDILVWEAHYQCNTKEHGYDLAKFWLSGHGFLRTIGKTMHGIWCPT